MADESPAQNEIEFINGATNILLVAPHGHHLDDENTGTLTRLVAEQNGCYAIINEVYRKPKKPNIDLSADKQNKRVNLNRKNQVKTHLKKEFLEPLIKYKDEIVEQFGNVFLLWIHGADDASVQDDIKKEASVNPKEIKVLLGYGQDADETQQRHTAQIEKVQDFIDRFNQVGLNAISANDTIRKKNADKEDDKDKQKSFCAWDIHNMNQFFRTGEHHDPNVESIQLEFRMADCRDTDANIENTARRIAQAISPLVSIEDPVVEKAYNKLALVFSQNYEQALMEAGQYIVRTFYGGQNDIENEPYDESFNYAPKAIENARVKKSPLEDSLRQLYAKISDDKERNTPSQAWIYNAVNLVVLQYDMGELLTEKDHFQTFRNLLLSQKLFLFSVEDDIRKKVIEDCHDKDKTLTVKQFKALLDSFQSKEDSEPLKLSDILRKPEELEKEENTNRLHPEKLIKEKKSTLNGLKKIAENKHDTAQFKIEDLKKELKKWERYSQNCDAAKGNIEKAIETKDKAPKKKSAKAKPKSEKSDNPNQDWADEGINISTGCSHNCRYCYARDGQIRRGAKTLETWHIEEPRPEMVNKEWRKTKRRKLFPSIHDITPGTYENSVKLIKNFLEPGNMLLIVSKPHPDLIEKLCDEIAEHKDQVLFRFTISATDNEILKFWEPGAPSFEDRLKALQIAQEKGFETSVSIEPMLDTPNISQLINSLNPYTTDSIWLGSMNNIGRRVKDKDNPEVKEHIDKIEAGQTPDKLKEIYLQYKDDPLIRFKGHIRQALKEIDIEVPRIEDDWRERRKKS